MLIPNSEGKQKIIKKHRELWIKSRDLIRLITKDSDDYDEKYMQIKFISTDKLPLNQTKEIPSMTAVVRTIFLIKSKYFPQFFLGECLCKLESNIRTLYFDRNDLFERNDVNKNECIKRV